MLSNQKLVSSCLIWLLCISVITGQRMCWNSAQYNVTASMTRRLQILPLSTCHVSFKCLYQEADLTLLAQILRLERNSLTLPIVAMVPQPPLPMLWTVKQAGGARSERGGGGGDSESECGCVTATGGVDLREFCLSMRKSWTQYMTKADQSALHCSARESLSNLPASSHEPCSSLLFSGMHTFPYTLSEKERITDAQQQQRERKLSSPPTAHRRLMNAGFSAICGNGFSLTLPRLEVLKVHGGQM